MAKDNSQKGRPGKGPSPQEIQEELSFLRQKCSSLSFRGRYAECVKTIEENLSFLYTRERWPESFFTVLRLHQKSYPALNKDQPYEEYMTALLKKNGIPHVFASLLKSLDESIDWSVEAFRARCAQSHDMKQYDDALGYADIAIKIDPGNAAPYLAKAAIYEDMDRDDDAAELYRQVLELNKQHPLALKGLSNYYTRQSPKKALEYIDRAIEQNPGEASFYASRAAVLRKLGDLKGAMTAIDMAIENDPYSADYFYERGELYRAQGHPGSAIPQYRLALSINEKHVPSLLRLVEYSCDNQPELALTYINTVCTMEPDNRYAVLKKATLLQRLGENMAAIRQFKMALELDPQCHEALNSLGELYMLDDRPHRALPYLTQAVELAPENPGYHFNKARAHQKIEENENAIKEYKATTALDETIHKAWGELGYLHMDKAPEEAVGYFSKAIQYAPENAFYYTAKGELLMQMPGQRENALECLNHASMLDPGNPDLHYKLGRLLEGADSLASAAEHYKKCVSLDPDNADAYYRLARLVVDTQPELALLYVNSAIRHSVTRGDYYFLKGKILAYLGQSPEAMEELKKSMATGDGGAELMGELADVLGGDAPRMALMYLNRAIEMAPDNPAYLCARAHLLYTMGEQKNAREQYEWLLKKNPDQHEALFGMARILADQNSGEALGYFDKAIAGAPAEAEYHAEKAAFLARGETTWQQAVEEFTTAITLNNQAWQVILQKAKVLDDHGETAAAMEEYRRVLLIYPRCAEASARMGQMLSDLSPRNALVYLDHAIELVSDWESFAWRAKILYRLGDETGGDQMCAETLYRGGETAPAFYKLAFVLRQCRPEAAMRYLRRALELDGGMAAYHLLQGRLYLDTAAYTEAAECFRRAVELDKRSHEARELLAETAYRLGAPDAMALVDAAHETKPQCASCAFLKARILDEREGDTASALEFVWRAVEVEPDNLTYREKLVELLAKKRSLLRLALERRALEKLRRRLAQPVEVAEPPVFTVKEAEAAPDLVAAAKEEPPPGAKQAGQ